MARKPPTTPRKNASQERSRATVDALIEATARILVREGFDKASTNRIAEVVGVSVGSLYQYYPGKEALVAAVIDRHNQEIMRVVRAAFAEVASQPIEKAVRRLVPSRSRRIASTPSCIASLQSRFRARDGLRM
jgi:AcrR family transcriptional regulator